MPVSTQTSRRQWFTQLAGSAGVLISFGHATAQDTPTLKEQLEFGLRARRPEEFAWIESVVDMVNTGQLPKKLVTVCFNWSRKKNTKYPYQYFVRSLRILASRQGIDVPASG